MSVDDLVAALHERGVRLVADGSRLRWRAPEGAMTIALVEALRDNKQELLALVTNDTEREFLPLDGTIAADEYRKHGRTEIVTRLSRLSARARLPEATALDRQLVHDWRTILTATDRGP